MYTDMLKFITINKCPQIGGGGGGGSEAKARS